MNTTITQPVSFDIDTYRITQAYGETLGSKKLITIVSVTKPPKGRFFRTSRDPGNTVDVYVLEDKVEGTFHLVSPQVAVALGGLVRPIALHLAVDRANNPFLIPVPFPSENGTRNPWHQSLLNAIEAAKEKWIRKLPRHGNRLKMETSASLRRRSDEEVAFHGEPDPGDPGRGRSGSGRCRGLSKARHQRSDLLPVEEQIRRHVGQRAQAGQGT